MTLQADVHVSLGSLDLRVALEVGDREVVAILGPNAAGKTTLLRTLAGLEVPARARVTLDGEVLDDTALRTRVPAARRPVGFVFQDHALFPHLSVLDNIAFGLRARGSRRAEADRDAMAWLERVSLTAVAGARPGSLSGGQRQRVALARALALRPRMLLLDEPFAALDAGVRAEMRSEMARQLASFEGVRLISTHDPIDALTLADRLVVLEEGRVVQSGLALEVTARPRSRFVADLVGLNLLRGRAGAHGVDLDGGGHVATAEAVSGDAFVAFHPRAVALHRRAPEGTPRNVWRLRVGHLEMLGDRVRVSLTGTPGLVAEVTAAAVRELALESGGEAWASVKATEVSVYPV